MTTHRQLLLDLPHRPALTGDDFLVDDTNREAVAWLDGWPAWPAPALVIHGAPGCGKTHLVHVFLARTGGRLVRVDDLAGGPLADRVGASPALALDDLGGEMDGRREEALFHLYTLVQESGRRLLITGREPPPRWPVRLADLRSRLNAAPAVRIGRPSDALIRAVVVKLFADRQLRVDESVVTELASRMERSLDAARRLVARIDEEALREGRKVTASLVRDVVGRERPSVER